MSKHRHPCLTGVRWRRFWQGYVDGARSAGVRLDHLPWFAQHIERELGESEGIRYLRYWTGYRIGRSVALEVQAAQREGVLVSVCATVRMFIIAHRRGRWPSEDAADKTAEGRLTNGFLRRVKPRPFVRPRLKCADGFTMSVQASSVHYCIPRVDGARWYKAVEVGFPSSLEPELIPYASDPTNLEDGVFEYVPVEIVDQIIRRHGGIAWTKSSGGQ